MRTVEDGWGRLWTGDGGGTGLGRDWDGTGTGRGWDALRIGIFTVAFYLKISKFCEITFSKIAKKHCANVFILILMKELNVVKNIL